MRSVGVGTCHSYPVGCEDGQAWAVPEGVWGWGELLSVLEGGSHGWGPSLSPHPTLAMAPRAETPRYRAISCLLTSFENLSLFPKE